MYLGWSGTCFQTRSYAWEIGSSFFGSYGDKINIVMFDAEYEKIKEAIRSNQGKSYKVIPVNNDSFETIFKIKNILDAGEYVCFQGDRYLNDSKKQSACFLGAEANFPSGPFLIASRMRKPVGF